MQYISTRGNTAKFSSAEVIAAGIAPDGGLFVPESVPFLDTAALTALVPLSYQERAVEILQKYLTDYSLQELTQCVNGAYSQNNFPPSSMREQAGKGNCPDVAPVVKVADNLHVLELWHGPTSAFKDMALQLLPRLLTRAAAKTGEKCEIVILVATSGDTGKAALDGFKDVDGTKIIVFYPAGGVSQIQELQMSTQEGKNVAVIAVKGNFDDTQTGVKAIFNSGELNNGLAARGYKLSSANSINWGRLVPQIVYYFSAYADLVRKREIAAGQTVNFAVPTGNFGNILALYYAKKMGLPAGRLICASNSNNVLTDFLKTGVYDRKRQFYKTHSPSMDILISSNLERLLYHIAGGDTELIGKLMQELQNTGAYRLDSKYLSIIQNDFYAAWADDEKTVAAIGNIHKTYGYIADPHTAVAWRAAEDYREQSGDMSPMVIVSTASPYKFSETALMALAGENSGSSEFEMLEKLSRLVNAPPVPAPLAGLKDKKVRHNTVCAKEEMPEAMLAALAKL